MERKNNMFVRFFMIGITLCLSAMGFAQEASPDNVYTIEGMATINSTWASYDEESTAYPYSYMGRMLAEVEEKDGSVINIRLKNVTYIANDKERAIGDILFSDIEVDADGHFENMEVEVSFMEGDLEGVTSWEAAICYAFCPGEVSGSWTADHKLEATFHIWVGGLEHFGNGEMYHEISFGKILDSFEYRRDVVSGEYGTIVLPFKPSEVEGIEKLYSLEGQLQTSKRQMYGLVLQEEEAMEAGVPYIFLANSSEIVLSAPIDAEKVSEPLNVINWSYANHGLQGTFGSLRVSSIGYWDYGEDPVYYEDFVNYPVYVIEGHDFKYVDPDTGVSIEPYHAYIIRSFVPIYTGTISDADAIVYSGDIATCLNPKVNSIKPETIYNIAGQRIGTLQRGVNIVNGKRVVLR